MPCLEANRPITGPTVGSPSRFAPTAVEALTSLCAGHAIWHAPLIDFAVAVFVYLIALLCFNASHAGLATVDNTSVLARPLTTGLADPVTTHRTHRREVLIGLSITVRVAAATSVRSILGHAGITD